MSRSLWNTIFFSQKKVLSLSGMPSCRFEFFVLDFKLSLIYVFSFSFSFLLAEGVLVDI